MFFANNQVWLLDLDHCLVMDGHWTFYVFCCREFEDEEEEGNPLVVSLQDKDSMVKNRSKAWFSKVKHCTCTVRV